MPGQNRDGHTMPTHADAPMQTNGSSAANLSMPTARSVPSLTRGDFLPAEVSPSI